MKKRYINLIGYGILLFIIVSSSLLAVAVARATHNSYQSGYNIAQEEMESECRKSDAVGYSRGWQDGFDAAIVNPNNPYGNYDKFLEGYLYDMENKPQNFK